MSRQSRRWTIGLIALMLGMGWLSFTVDSSAADPAKTILPDDVYPKMLAYAVDGIKKSLKGSPKPELVGKARTAAVMIAAYAQQNLSGPDGQQRATVRDAALKLADLIKGRNYAEAIKQAEALAKLPANPNAKKEKVKLLDKHVTMYNLMNQFNHPPYGGWGIHRQFYAYQLGMIGTIPRRDLRDPLLLKAYHVAVTADLVNSKVPPKNAKAWKDYTAQLRDGALELAKAVKTKNGKDGLYRIAKITNSCTKCHKAFDGGP